MFHRCSRSTDLRCSAAEAGSISTCGSVNWRKFRGDLEACGPDWEWDLGEFQNGMLADGARGILLRGNFDRAVGEFDSLVLGCESLGVARLSMKARSGSR